MSLYFAGLNKSAQSIASLSEAFLVGKAVGGCSERTIGVYRSWLDKLLAHVGEDPAALDSIAVVQFFTGLREHGLSASTVHQAYRTLKTFTRWLLATGVLRCNPLAGLSIKMPSILPEVPTEDELRAVLECCPTTLVGARNRAMILTGKRGHAPVVDREDYGIILHDVGIPPEEVLLVQRRAGPLSESELIRLFGGGADAR